MTWICYIGIEISARVQYALLGVEMVMLVVFSVVALVRVWTGHAAATSIPPSWSWFNPFQVPSLERTRRRACSWRCSSTGAGTPRSP